MNLLPEDAIILKRLFSRPDEWIDPYDFHQSNLLSPGQLARSIRKLLSEVLIEYQQERIRLTSYGREWTIANKSKFYKVNKSWKDVPSEFKRPRLNIDEVYLPENINKINFLPRKRQEKN